MTPCRPRHPHHLAGFVVLALLVGVTISILSMNREKEYLLRDISTLTSEISGTLNHTLIMELASPDSSPLSRERIRERLQQQFTPLLSLNPNIRSISLIRQDTPDTPPHFLSSLTNGLAEAPTAEALSTQNHAPAQLIERSSSHPHPTLLTLQQEDGSPLIIGYHLIGEPGHKHPSVLLMIGFDAQAIRDEALKATYIPLALTLILIIGLSVGLIYRTRSKADLRPGEALSPYIDSSLAAFIGIILTLSLYWYLDQNHKRYAAKDLEARASMLERKIVQTLFDVGNLGNKAIAAFFRSSRNVKSDEFTLFTEHLLNFSAVEGWAWITPLEPGDHEAFLQTVEEHYQIDDYSLWEFDPQGNRIPVTDRDIHYPIVFASPELARIAMQGFDMAAEPARAAALQSVFESRLPKASSFTSLLHRPERPTGLLIFHPVIATGPDGQEKLSGITLASISIQKLLDQTLAHSEDIRIDLFEAQGGEWVSVVDPTSPRLPNLHQYPLHSIHPILIFGNTYALVVQPQPRYASHSYIEPQWVGLVFGLVLTAVLTWLFGFQARLRHELEENVSARTRELAESERKYRLITENATDLIWSYDVETRQTLFVSSSVEAVTGYTVEEALRQTLDETIAPESMQDVEDKMRQALTDFSQGIHKTYTHVIKEICKGGHTISSEVTYRISRNPDTGRLEICGATRDVSERIEREKHLHLLAKALDAASNMILIYDYDGHIEWSNRAFSEFTGYSFQEAKGMRPGDLLSSGTHEPAFFHQMWDTIRAGNIWSGEIVNRRKDGTTYPEALNITPVKDDDGKITHYIAIKRDLTEEKAREQGHLRAQRLESIGFLAGGIAHDLNNALAPILMSVDLLKRDDLTTDDRDEILESIESSARRSARMVSQVLDFARGVEGRKEQITPARIAHELESFIKDTIPKTIAFAIKLDPRINDKAIWSDPTQIHQVLINLSLNAIDSMPDGGKLSIDFGRARKSDMQASPEYQERPGQYLKISVQDQGTGMPGDVLQKIFDPFFTTKGIGKGSGLGLSTSHSIVKSHGGFITVSSKPGTGSTFNIFLPIHSQTTTTSTPAEEAPTPHGEGETILIVDDEPLVRTSLKMVLDEEGYQTLTAENGSAAIDLFQKHHANINLVISDMSMPGMNGAAAAEIMHQINPHIPIILSSGQPIEKHKYPIITHFLPKPYSPTDVLKAIRKILD